jgi:hypothetical protein
MQADGGTIDAGSRINGGHKLRLLTLDDLDGRTKARQRAEELRERLIAERGGIDRLDVMRRAHTNTWSMLTVMIESEMARYALGEPIEPANVATLINARRREGEVIGAPEPRDVTPSLEQYAAMRQTNAEAAGEFGEHEATSSLDYRSGAPPTATGAASGGVGS